MAKGQVVGLVEGRGVIKKLGRNRFLDIAEVEVEVVTGRVIVV